MNNIDNTKNKNNDDYDNNKVKTFKNTYFKDHLRATASVLDTP